MDSTFKQKDYDPNNLNDIKEAIEKAYEKGLGSVLKGKVADYIPELAKANPEDFGICVINMKGERICFGQTNKRFSIQSISKVINLAAALKFLGHNEVFAHVQMEPTGDAFNSILKLDTASDIPFNPLINAGAIQIMSLLSNFMSFEQLLEFAKSFCMDEDICLNEKVYLSEAQTGDRNRAIAYLLKSKGVLQGDPDRTLDLYFRMCSLNVSAESLANMGLLLANRGRNPFTGQQIADPDHIRTIKAMMFTCGLYDQSGEFGVDVGLPAKSGVGGGIVASYGDHWGIGTYGPALNEKGNSAPGIEALKHMSRLLKLNIFS